ncbi:MAG TPA: macro domain-containing protein [Candidatus Binataceae bacterium]|jgi:O-acetyl-ADP-ribose deacetylase (regulator of RNase III)
MNGWKHKLRIRRADLTESATDAIVNAANTELILGAGVAGAIKRRGGPAIAEECERIGPIPLGEAAITSGGNLSARFVIHAASMELGGRTTQSSLADAVRNSLKRAAENGVRSIAFPAIGTGIAGFPLDRCARVMLAEFRDHFASKTSLELIEVVLFDERAAAVFEQTLRSMPD